ncbi:aldo/keto reductase [candidate division KSB1 bacterium]|nr:aldo/keto reductase [candidate division KSB1 bacterium]
MFTNGLQLRPLGTSGENVTFIGFGALEIGRDWGIGDHQANLKPSFQEAEKVLNRVLDLGINLIDTASAYHRSEERIGRAISHRKNEFLLASKCGEHNRYPTTYYDFSYHAVKHSIDKSIKLTNVDQIDLMQIHFGPDAQRTLDEGEVIAAMSDARQEGKIRLLGASAWGNIAEQCIDLDIFDVMQLEYNLINRSDEYLIEKCSQKKIGVLIRGGLARGMLTPKFDRYQNHIDNQNRQKINAMLEWVDHDSRKLTALALHFLARNKGISSVLIGSKKIEHIEMCLSLMESDIDAELLEKAATFEL